MEDNSKNKIIIIAAVIMLIAGIVLMIVNKNTKPKEKSDKVFSCEKTIDDSLDYKSTVVLNGLRKDDEEILKFSYKQSYTSSLSTSEREQLKGLIVASIRQEINADIETREEGNTIIVEYEINLKDYDQATNINELKGELESSGYKCK